MELIKAFEESRKLNVMLLNLFNTISHNFNTYTSNIKLLLDIIETEVDQNEKKIYLNHLQSISNDLNNTIIDLSQIVFLQDSFYQLKEPLNVSQYLEKVKKTIDGYRKNEKLKIINKIPPNTFINHIPAYLESILLNFCTNSIKYAHPDRFPEIEFSYLNENGYDVLKIKDNGLGIDLEKYGHLLFGLNQTFHIHENANGIGMYITKYQIEALKGFVTVNSNLGEGTTFKIHFVQ